MELCGIIKHNWGQSKIKSLVFFLRSPAFLECLGGTCFSVKKYYSDPNYLFGESQPNEDVDGDNIELSYNLRFPGQYYDGETGKYYNFNRDYNPVTGRYVQSDPIGLDGGMNLFGYALVNSLKYSDPTGKVYIRNAPVRACTGYKPRFIISPFERDLALHATFLGGGGHWWLNDGDFNNILSRACLPTYSNLQSVLLDNGDWGYKRIISTYEDYRYDFVIGNAWIYYKDHGKTIIGFLDYFNFNKASHRDKIAENATSFGRMAVNMGIIHEFLVWNGVNDDPIFWPDDYPYGW